MLPGNALPGNADRYTVLASQHVNSLPDMIAACNLLGLRYFVKRDELAHTRVNFYIFLDEQGMKNFLTGLYAPPEED